MKILQVSTIAFADPRFYTSNEYTLCRTLAKLGHEVTLFTSNRHPKWQLLEDRRVRSMTEIVDGFTIRRFTSGPELGIVPLMPSILYEIINSDWDILHAHTILAPSSFYSALASRLKGKPLIVTQHDYIFGGTHGPKLFLQMSNNYTLGRFTMHASSAVIGLSSEAVKFVQRFGAAANKTRVIPNSVDTTLFRPDQRNLLTAKWGIERPIILFVGRLTKVKGTEDLLRAYKKVISNMPNAKLVVIGKGPEETRLIRLAKEADLSQVHFLGRVPREDMPHIYAGCDLMVLPSSYEPFGNVVLEAMASGLPVIGSRVGGMVDTISHGVTGFHIRPADVEQLASYITKLLSDETLLARMSRASRQLAVERFDDNVVARKIEELYGQILSK